jgi:hypothetical protein
MISLLNFPDSNLDGPHPPPPYPRK